MGYKIAIMGTRRCRCLRRRSHGAGRRGRHVHRSMARERRNNEGRRPEGLAHPRRAGMVTTKVRALHLTELQQAAKEKPFDIAFVCMKSYDTEWATVDDRPVPLAQRVHRFAAELHERGDHRRRRRLGQGRSAASPVPSPSICASPAMCAAPPAKAATNTRCSAPARCTAASPTGCRKSSRLVALADSALVTVNLWGERWSKLVTNAMATACPPAPV